ncbi:MAG TPA: hypothetical protein VN851_00150, partial [Thermoanaerobaculia bacterium]|nr:hypothetical protein [Thermoanaerobaculia bacterium]
MDDEFHTGLIMLVLALGSVAAGILAIVVRARMSTARRLSIGAVPAAVAFVAGLAGFFVVAFMPWMILAPAAFFAVWAVAVWRRRGSQATLRGALLLVLALLWMGLAIYGDRMNRWSATVIGAIRVDLLFTFALAAVWAFLGVWLGREVDPGRAEEGEADEIQAVPDGPLTAGIR